MSSEIQRVGCIKVVENKSNISSQFFKAIYQLAGMNYNPETFSQHSLEARAIVSQFVYEPLNADQKGEIDRRSKTHRMQIPPALDSMIDLYFVSNQVNTILEYIAEGKSFDDLNLLYTTGEPVSKEKFDSLLFKLLKPKC